MGLAGCALQIQEEALQLLDKLGAQYEKDHEKDIKESVFYLPDEAQALGWHDSNVASFVYSSSLGEDDGAKEKIVGKAM